MEEPIIIHRVIKKPGNQYVLELSNGQEITVHEDLLVRYQLLAGSKIDRTLRTEIDYENQLQKGISLGIGYISYRPRSKYEVIAYLKRKEIEPDYIEPIIERLEEKGYLDDLSFAQKWIEHRRSLNPKGKIGLSYELRQKGISSEIIENVLQQIDIEQEMNQALQLARKKMNQWRKYSWQEAQPRFVRFLAYRGYSQDVIFRIIPILKEEFSTFA